MRVFRSMMAATLVAIVMLPAAAAADDLIVIPVSGFARGSEGDLITIATIVVPDETVGATCQITGTTVNQSSVHEGNDLLITTNGQTLVVPNFEDAGFIQHAAGEVAAVGSTIQVQIRFGPDGLSSGGFRVSVDCDIETIPTTVTTAVPTTTAPEPTATTDGPVFPSTPEVPAIEGPPTGPTTTVPATTEPADAPTTELPAPTEAPSTSVDGNSPTSEAPPAGPTTEAEPTTTTTAAPTTAAPTTEAPPAGPETNDDVSLPVTGSPTRLILGFGLVFIAAGLMLRRLASVAA